MYKKEKTSLRKPTLEPIEKATIYEKLPTVYYRTPSPQPPFDEIVKSKREIHGDDEKGQEIKGQQKEEQKVKKAEEGGDDNDNNNDTDDGNDEIERICVIMASGQVWCYNVTANKWIKHECRISNDKDSAKGGSAWDAIGGLENAFFAAIKPSAAHYIGNTKEKEKEKEKTEPVTRKEQKVLIFGDNNTGLKKHERENDDAKDKKEERQTMETYAYVVTLQKECTVQKMYATSASGNCNEMSRVKDSEHVYMDSDQTCVLRIGGYDLTKQLALAVCKEFHANVTDSRFIVKDVPSMIDTRFNFASAAFTRHYKVIVAGGQVDEHLEMDRCEILDRNTSKWTSIKPIPTGKRSGCSGIALSMDEFVIVGSSPHSQRNRYSRLPDLFQATFDQWNCLPAMKYSYFKPLLHCFHNNPQILAVFGCPLPFATHTLLLLRIL
ncbi:hypothetical protein RFI_16117 [Reticulomyxa filosa]|uniref:Kelch motif family protein n=1 Tax=Reticulomyxa filosa TaxID=46433 RepID=X6N4X6_RETFI|nr:hypothetical protein RFI_16117 [Reticulomyxa filosa]|eukprot:ETO21086.1 hypothetical protein RFI_16117 [Reticulomyxa filosa]